MPNKYQVRGWAEHFETAKTAGYVHKASVVFPLKQGLGYRRLVRRPNGPSVYGAWCSMIIVLSKQAPPRMGYLTHSGAEDGIPYTAQDLEMLTDIPTSVFAEMLEVCSRPEIGWLDIVEKDDSGAGDLFGDEKPILPPSPLETAVKQANAVLKKCTACPHDEMKAEWNRLCGESGLSRSREWPTDRVAKMWKMPWFREYWKLVFEECHRTEWCRTTKAGVIHVLRNDKSGMPNALRYYEAAMDKKEAPTGKAKRTWKCRIIETDGMIRFRDYDTEVQAVEDLKGKGYVFDRAKWEWRAEQ